MKKQSGIEKFSENIKKLINYFKSEELSDEKFNELLVRRNKINLSSIEQLLNKLKTTDNPETKDLIKLSRLDRKAEYYKDILDNPKMFQQKKRFRDFSHKIAVLKNSFKRKHPYIYKIAAVATKTVSFTVGALGSMFMAGASPEIASAQTGRSGAENAYEAERIKLKYKLDRKGNSRSDASAQSEKNSSLKEILSQDSANHHSLNHIKTKLNSKQPPKDVQKPEISKKTKNPTQNPHISRDTREI